MKRGLRVVLLSACASIASADPPAAGIEECLSDWRKFGLPLPTEGARLISLPGNHYAFLLKPPGHGFHGEFLIGLRVEKPDSVVPWKLVVDVDLNHLPSWWRRESLLIFAVQLHSIGSEALAREFWDEGLRDNSYLPQPWVDWTAWRYWEAMITERESDRVEALVMLSRIHLRSPNPIRRELIEDLEATIQPSSARAGSPEGMIDALVESTRGEDDATVAALSEIGFEAVPALLTHWDDRRLTRRLEEGYDDSGTWIVTVGDLVRSILREYSGWNRRAGGRMTLEDAKTWWTQVRAQPEGAYFETIPTSAARQILARRYPEHFKAAFRRELAERSNSELWEWDNPLKLVNLTVPEKVALLDPYVRSGSVDRRIAAFRLMTAADRDATARILTKLLKDLPENERETEALALAPAVGYLADAGTYEALARMAKRFSVESRMAVLRKTRSAGCRCWGFHEVVRERNRWLEFALNFLDDDGERDVSRESSGIGLSRLEVRDAVALEIAGIMGKRLHNIYKWTPDDWATLRDEMRAVAENRLYEERR